MYTILLLILSLINSQVSWSIQTGAEGGGVFLLVNSPESSLSNLYPTDKGHHLSGESNTVVNTLCANVPKQ